MQAAQILVQLMCIGGIVLVGGAILLRLMSAPKIAEQAIAEIQSTPPSE